MPRAAPLVVFLAALISLAAAAGVDTGDSFQAFAAKQADDFVTEGTLRFAKLAVSYEALNDLRALAAADVAALYQPADAAAVESAISGSCNVRLPVEYQANATASLHYLCCQARVATGVALPLVPATISEHFWGVAFAQTADHAGHAMRSIMTIYNTSLAVTRRGYCKTGQLRHFSELPGLLYVQYTRAFGDMVAVFRQVSIIARQAAGCLANAPSTTTCATSAPLALANAPYRSEFYTIDPVFASVCSATALAEFEEYRLVQTCDP